jgi:hypothetical protein
MGMGMEGGHLICLQPFLWQLAQLFACDGAFLVLPLSPIAIDMGQINRQRQQTKKKPLVSGMVNKERGKRGTDSFFLHEFYVCVL